MTATTTMTKKPAPSPADSLGRDIRLSHFGQVQVLGVRVRFEASDPAVLAAAEEAFGPLSGDGGLPEDGSSPRPVVRVYVQDGDEGPNRRARPRYRMPEPERLLVATAGSFGVAEIERKTSYAYVSPSLLADVRQFQYGILEPLTLVLVTGPNRQPLHAAVVAQGRVALLLAGPSGSGKSSLAYAAARDGLGVLSEDTACVQSEPQLRVWTVPRPLHLLPDAVRFFPELKSRTPELLPTGKTKFVVPLDLPRARSRLPLAHVGVCLLTPGAGPPRCAAIGPAEVEGALTERLEAGFDLFAQSAAGAARTLAAGALRCWRLQTSADPRESVSVMRQMLAELTRAADGGAGGGEPVLPGAPPGT